MTYPQLNGDSYQDFEPYMSVSQEDQHDGECEREQEDLHQWLETNEGAFRDEMQGEK